MPLTRLSLQELVGTGYADFWKTKKRYRVCNALCVRRYSNTLRDSVFSDLKWAIHRLGVDAYFDCTVSPMQITRRSTGQKILFRGLDDGLKITSISVDYGTLCFVWINTIGSHVNKLL